MKVLFVCSGNSSQKVVPFIQAQGDSLAEAGVDVSYFSVVGHGLKSYLQNARTLREYLKEHRFDLIHAHYTLSGWVAVIAIPGLPIVLSLMGNDAYGEYIGENKVKLSSRWLTWATFMIQPFVQVLISKSPNIERFVYRKRISHVIPNGVRLEQFQVRAEGFREELGLDRSRKYVLFLGNKEDIRKNYQLAHDAVRLLNRPDVELVNPFPISHNEVVKYLNSVDVFILCSFMEGSPNVVKEAMACNCPLVATDVGDTAWVIGDTPGCYVSSFDATSFSQKIGEALAFVASSGRTSGRKRLEALELSSEKVAFKIKAIYKKLMASG